MKNKNLPFYIDIVFCCIVIPLMITTLPVERWMRWNSEFVYILIGWIYAVYFMIRYYCIPSFFKDKKHRIYAIIVIALTIVVTYLITQYKMEFPHHPTGVSMRFLRKGPERVRLHQQAAWFMYLVVSSFSVAVGLLSELYKQIMYRQEMEFEKKKAELALYKAQINPHFLYNTLNTLYGLMISNSSKAEKAFMEFIDMMKYMYTDSVKDKVPLSSEVDYIEKYIELQKNRFNEHTKVFFSYENDYKYPNAEIVPMVLITFVENALKYGVSSHCDSDIYITVNFESGELAFTTQNPIFDDLINGKSNGMGIYNCKKRLELLYPNKYTLDIMKENGEFRVLLTIKLI